MKAVVLKGACNADEMRITEVDKPTLKNGWVLIKVKAFGLNHAELILRKYEVNAPYIQKPIIPGIECVGLVEEPCDSLFHKGDRVVAFMGGMGRSFNGSYAEFILVPTTHVFLVKSKMNWDKLAAIPETFYTAFGSLFECLQLKKEDTLLVHGATSALGLSSVQLAKAVGAKVIGTTRKEERYELVKKAGADTVILDDETLAKQVLTHFPDGITKVLELVGPVAVPLSSKLLKKKGIICVTGQLGGNPREGFDVIKNIPNGVYLSSFYSNYPTQKAFDNILKMIEKHTIEPIIGKIMPFEQIAMAHDIMENNRAKGKLVIRVDSQDE